VLARSNIPVIHRDGTIAHKEFKLTIFGKITADSPQPPTTPISRQNSYDLLEHTRTLQLSALPQQSVDVSLAVLAVPAIAALYLCC
jgi:hypothetical protein